MNDEKYNANGIAITGAPMNQSPASNPGVVYQPANTPTNPGATKVATQLVRNFIFKTKDGGIVNIGTQNTSPATTAGAAGIYIFNTRDQLTPVISMLNGGEVDGPVNVQIINNPAADNTIAPFIVSQSANPHNSTEIADFETDVVVATHFSPTLRLIQNSPGADNFIWISDGTTPNGHLNGHTGDICLNGPNGDLFTCVSGTTWTDTGGGSGSSTIAGSMYLAGSQSIPNSTTTKVALDTASITEGLTIDTTNNRITCLTAGTYYFSGQVTYAAPQTVKTWLAIFILMEA